MTTPILLNALHTTTGGGLTYLQNLLPLLAQNPRYAWTILAPATTLSHLNIPANVQVWEAPPHGFVRGHVWEQTVLPWLARQRGFKAVLCNANFVPLLAPKPMPILHTTTTAYRVTRGQVSLAYWALLWFCTFLGIVRAPKVFSLTPRLLAEYTPFLFRWLRQKGVMAPPAITPPNGKTPARNPNLVLAVGDMYAQKDYPTLLHAFALLLAQNPKARLHIVGRPVFANVEAELQTLIQTLNIGHAVKLHGPMPHHQLLTHMAQAGVFVATSTVESFNIPILEAMAAGTPVVVLNAPYVADVVGQAALVVARGGNTPAALAVALYGVIENPVIQQNLVRLGLAHTANARWETTANAILQAIPLSATPPESCSPSLSDETGSLSVHPIQSKTPADARPKG